MHSMKAGLTQERISNIPWFRCDIVVDGGLDYPDGTSIDKAHSEIGTRFR